MTTTPAHDTLTAVLTNTSSDYLDNRFGMSASVEEIADGILRAHTAEVRAAAFNEAEQVLRSRARHTEDGCDFCNGVDFAADTVRDLDAAARPDNTTGAH